MPLCSALVRKVNGLGEVSVAVEVLPCNECQLKFDPFFPTEVFDSGGNAIEAGPMCLSGARYAMRIFSLSESIIIIRSAKGILESQDDSDALCIATILAIGLALKQDDAIPKEVFSGYGGDWESGFREGSGGF